MAYDGRTGTAATVCALVFLAGCGGGSSSANTEARFVALVNQLCRETHQPVLGPARQARIKHEFEQFRVLASEPHKPRRVQRYLTDTYAQGESSAPGTGAKIYADKKALGLSDCVGPSTRENHQTRASGNVPTLSRAQVRRALGIMSRSSALAHLLHGTRYQIAHKGPWSTGGEDNRLVGAVFWLNLAHPTNLAGWFPTATDEADRVPPYFEQSKYIKASAVEALYVQVDLTRGVVAGVVAQR
jgi:hypothetical protein